MSRRKIGLMVVLLVIGVAFVLEGWTFLDLVWMQFSDQETDTTEQTVSEKPKRKGIGDVISLRPACKARIERMHVYAKTSGWRFRMTVSFVNSGNTPVRIDSQSVTLTSGETVPVTRTIDVPANEVTTEEFSVDLPKGTEVNGWSLRWTDHPGDGEWSDRMIALGKAPVRRGE